ncbi:MAG: amidohydrolase family protein [Beijerinckiaceae bacterium]
MLDVFNHFTPRSFFDKLGGLIPGHPILTAFPRLPALLDLDERLRLLDEFDGLQQIISLANPPIEILGPPGKTPDLAKEANDLLADICRRHPDHFPGFVAALPLNNVEASVAEADRAIRQLGARGVQMFTHVNGVPLSAPELRPVFAAMAAHDLPIWVHPIRGAQTPDYAGENLSEDEIWFMFGWPYETTACVTRLIYSGLFDEHPELKIITHHMGGMIPFFSGKIKLGFGQIFFGTRDRNPQAEKRGLKKPPVEYFKQLYADTAVNGEAAATACGHAFFGSKRCLFATDAPFDAEKGRGLIRDTIAAVSALDVTREERQMIFEGNARALLQLSER